MIVLRIPLLVIFLGIAHAQVSCPVDPEIPQYCLNRNIPDPRDCGRFYKCDTLCTAVLQYCPIPLHFSPIAQICVYPEQANCIPTPLPSSSTAVPSTTRPTTPSTTTQPTTRPTTATTQPSTRPSTPPTTTPTTTTPTTTTPTTTRPTTTQRTTPTTPPIGGFLGPSLSVALDYAIVGVLDPVVYNDVLVNYRNTYDNGVFRVPEAGPYFFHTSIAARSGMSVNYGLYTYPTGISKNYNILRTSRDHNGADTIGRDVMLPLGSNDLVCMASIDPSGVYSDSNRQTSWSGFGVAAAMRNVVAFSAYRDVGYTQFGRIPFTEVEVNIGSNYNPNTGYFTAPVTGIYYVSYSTGAAPRTGQRTQLRSSVEGRICEMWREGTSINGRDLMSRATLLYLERNEQIWVELVGGQLDSIPATRALSFTGFLFEPWAPAVAWSVHRLTSYFPGGPGLSPVEFQHVMVDVGGAWDRTYNRVTIPVGGLYLLNINAGSLAFTTVSLNIQVNGQRSEANILRQSTTDNGHNALGRSIMGSFDAGDVITITSPPGNGIYSDSDRQTSFSGFLVYAY